MEHSMGYLINTLNRFRNFQKLITGGYITRYPFPLFIY